MPYSQNESPCCVVRQLLPPMFDTEIGLHSTIASHKHSLQLTSKWGRLSHTTPGELPLLRFISARVPRRMKKNALLGCHRYLNSNRSSFLLRPLRFRWPQRLEACLWLNQWRGKLVYNHSMLRSAVWQQLLKLCWKTTCALFQANICSLNVAPISTAYQECF